MSLRAPTAALAVAACALAAAGTARAEVVAAQPTGFEVRERAHVAATPEQVWAALGRIAAWWSSEHTYSGSAANLSLSLEPGGCFCERWPGGVVRHMSVALAMPPRTLRLEGALGPLGGLGVAGHLTIALAPAAGGTDLTAVYDVGGYAKDGLQAMAGPVDEVLGEQVARLSRYAAAGRP